MFSRKRTKRTDYLFALLTAMALLICGPVNANADEVITIKISATVAYVEDPGGTLDRTIRVGDVISGSYAYDLATSDSNPLSTVGDYWHRSPPHGITLDAGRFAFETDPDDVNFLVEIVNNHGVSPRDNYLLRSYSNLPLPNGAVVEHISWQLDDPSAAALSSDALPAVPPILHDWQSTFGLTITGFVPDPGDPTWPLYGTEFFVRAHVTLAELSDDRVDLLIALVEDVLGLNLQQGISNSLDAKLDTALQALDDVNQNNNVAAVNALESFINAVEAQSGNMIPEADANNLIAAAQDIIALLSGA